MNSLLDSLNRYAIWGKARSYYGSLYFFAFTVTFFASFARGLGGVAAQVPLFFLLYGVGLVWTAAIVRTLIFKPHGEGEAGAKRQHDMRVKDIIRRENPLLLFAGIGFAIGALNAILWYIFSRASHIPPIFSSLHGFMPTLWQVHAALIGFTVVVIMVVITVVANERERTRTWGLYMRHSRFLLIVWVNLWAIVNEGIATLLLNQSSDPSVVLPHVAGLVLSAGILFLVSVSGAAWLYWVTVRFIDDAYIEDLAAKRIVSMIPNEVDRQLDTLITNARRPHDRRS